MTFWLYRAGRDDEFLSQVREFGLLLLSFHGTPDLSEVANKEELRRIVKATYPERSASTVTKYTNEIANFRWSMKTNDDVILPFESGRRFLHGKVTTQPYHFFSDLPIRANHARGVRWIGEVFRDQLSEDLLKTLRARVTIRELAASFVDELDSAGYTTVDVEHAKGMSSDSSVSEGIARFVEFKMLLRDQAILNRVWRNHLAENGGAGRCAGCEFTHADRGMFDFHHITPLALGARQTDIEDLLILCPRCHRTAHHGRGANPRSLEELRAEVASH